MAKYKDKAEKLKALFARHPDKDVIYMASDGRAFFTPADAESYAGGLKDNKVGEFTRGLVDAFVSAKEKASVPEAPADPVEEPEVKEEPQTPADPVEEPEVKEEPQTPADPVEETVVKEEPAKEVAAPPAPLKGGEDKKTSSKPKSNK